MDRPSKKQIRAAVEKLKGKHEDHPVTGEHALGKTAEQKTHQRIGMRKSPKG